MVVDNLLSLFETRLVFQAYDVDTSFSRTLVGVSAR